MSALPYTCTEAFQRLDDYLDRELSPDETAAVMEHLELCAICAGTFIVEQALLDGVREKLRRIAAPPGLMDRIRRRLEASG